MTRYDKTTKFALASGVIDIDPENPHFSRGFMTLPKPVVFSMTARHGLASDSLCQDADEASGAGRLRSQEKMGFEGKNGIRNKKLRINGDLMGFNHYQW